MSDKRLGMLIDLSVCIGCNACTVACRQENETPLTKFNTWVESWDAGIDGRVTRANLPKLCNHCANPACVKVCPTGAMHQDADTGLVSVDADKCIGCGYCHMACPYNAPKVDREKGHSVKCDGCKERVAAGEKPVCVEACPARALDFGPVDAMSKLGEQADIAPLPAKSYTSPNLYVKPSKDAKPAGDASAKVVNPLEVM